MKAVLRRVWPLLRPRTSRTQVLVAVLVFCLGFAFAVQVHSTGQAGGLRTARQEDLDTILDDLNTRSDRLRQEIAGLQATRDRLLNGSDRAKVALEETRKRAQQLAILAGTVAATGPGVRITISDSGGKVRADLLLNAVEELRDAGAEAIQIGDVRVVAASYLIDARDGGVAVDGRPLRPPYVLLAIGDPRTLAEALAIPGGVVDSVDALSGARANVTASAQIRITALRALGSGAYAHPTQAAGG
jgi:uncharacterized protein YlxW (UPF0749 family)